MNKMMWCKILINNPRFNHINSILVLSFCRQDLKRSFDIRGIGHVDTVGRASAAFFFDDRLGDVRCLLAQIDAKYLGALSRKQHGRCFAIAPDRGVRVIANGTGTRNEGNFAVEIKH